jgi:hypothetical protein
MLEGRRVTLLLNRMKRINRLKRITFKTTKPQSMALWGKEDRGKARLNVYLTASQTNTTDGNNANSTRLISSSFLNLCPRLVFA